MFLQYFGGKKKEKERKSKKEKKRGKKTKIGEKECVRREGEGARSKEIKFWEVLGREVLGCSVKGREGK